MVLPKAESHSSVQIDTELATKAGVSDVDTHLKPLQEARVQRGMIAVWSGSVHQVPNKWLLCNGSCATGSCTPDLTDKFIRGCSSTEGCQKSGGAGRTPTTSSGQHSHDGSTKPHTLAIHEMPAHRRFACSVLETKARPCEASKGRTRNEKAIAVEF